MRRILFVSCNYASDYGVMVWGTYIRMRMLLEAARKACDAVDLLLFVAPDFIEAADPVRVAESIRRAWGIEVTVHVALRSQLPQTGHSATLRSFFDIRFQKDYGDAGGPAQAAAVAAAVSADTMLVVAHRLDAALAVVQGVRGRVPIAINLDDIEHVARQRRTRRLKRSIATLRITLQWYAIRRAEMAVLRAVDLVLVCSDEERRYLLDRGLKTRVDVVRNAVPFESEQVSSDDLAPSLLFIGSYGYEPNVEAAEELIHRIFPAIRAVLPDARLLIAGARSERLPSYGTAVPGVEFVGFVDDLAALYRRVSLACCPIRAGGGTRIKIVEASAWRTPTVSTALGAEGLDLEPGREIVLAESSNEIAAACVQLLNDRARARAIGIAAFEHMRRSYNRDSIVLSLVRLLQDLSSSSPADRSPAVA